MDQRDTLPGQRIASGNKVLKSAGSDTDLVMEFTAR